MSGHHRAGNYRPDIDGLRALAVLSVVGYHAAPGYLPGGFAGVDVFFVISGYLICGIILDGVRNGTFSLAEFYGRRIRRIFPALILVLAAAWTIGWYTQIPNDFANLCRHILAGAGFYANLLTYSEIGYFDAPAASKPLLHLWSLGVEEQFYVFFPLLLLALWRTRAALPALTVLAAASFATGLWLTARDPSAAFYLPFSRIWELWIGGALAWAGPLQMKRRVRETMSCIGILAIATSMALIPAHGFPGWFALVPTLGAAMVLASGGAWINRAGLSHPAVVYVGLVSYPLYLWHWPLLVFARQEYVGARPSVVTACAVAAAVAAAVLTYHLVERPIRARRTLTRPSMVLGGAMAAVAAISIVSFKSDGMPGRYPAELQALMGAVDLGAFSGTEAEAEAAADSSNHPGPRVVLFGDSHAAHLFPGLRWLQRERNFSLAIVQGFDGQCGQLGEPQPAAAHKCSKGRPGLEQLAELKPDIVIVGGFWWQYTRIERLAGILRSIKEMGVQKIVVLGCMPFWHRESQQQLLYKAFLATGIVPERLSTGMNRDKPDVDAPVKAISAASGATFVSATDVLCNEDGCLARLGNTAADIVQFDSTHFSTNGSRFMAKAIEQRVFDGSSPISVGSIP